MSPSELQITIPRAGFEGLAAIASLPISSLEKLSKLSKSFAKVADLGALIGLLSNAIALDGKQCAQMTGVLVTLNQLRIDKKASAEQLVKSLTAAVDTEASDEWKRQYLEGWTRSIPYLPGLFEPNNYFALFGKTHELWANRQSRVSGVKVLTDLRPVYNEDATSTIAFVLTNTIVVDFFEGSDDEERTLQFSIDPDDLSTLREELDRALTKAKTLAAECAKWKMDLISVGGE